MIALIIDIYIAPLLLISLLMLSRFSLVSTNTGGVIHFNNCKLCECFTIYENRDIFNQGPAGMVQLGFDVTEDECLNICLSEIGECAAVVYGLVGGRNVFTCELYAVSETPILPDGPRYTYALNVYIPNKSRPCPVRNDGIRILDAGPVDETPEKRKAYFQNLYSQMNPFNWGRKK